MNTARHIAIIPAKLKSRRCKDKNWKEFQHGESLAETKYLTVMASGYYNNTILSIDFDPSELTFVHKPRNQYQMAHCRGWETIRRPWLLKDDSVEVVLHALRHTRARDDDFYHLLQPTSPFVQKETMLGVVNAVRSNNCAVVTVNPMYKPSGGIYAGRVGNLRKYRNFYEPFVMPVILDWYECVDIDEEYDFQIARSLLE